MTNRLNLRLFWTSMRHWLWLVIGCALAAALVAYAVTSQMPSIYSATVTLMIQQTPSASLSDYTAILLSERQASTYAEVVKEEPVIRATIEQLGLNMTPGEIKKKLSVELVRNTQLIRVRIKDTDSYRAPRIANGIADALIAQTQTLQNTRYSDSLNSMQGQMQDLATLITEMVAAIDALGTPQNSEEQAELARFQTILAGYRNSYASLLQAHEQTRLTAANSADNIVILSRAQEPSTKIGPSELKNALLAAFTTAILALGVLFLIEYLDDTVKTPDDVKDLLGGVGVLGAIGQSGKRDVELVTLAHPLSPISEAFRALRTNIRFMSVDKPIRTLLVTSAGPREGKSLVVSNLAVTMAQTGLKVIIVDADLRRPRIHKIFDHNTQYSGLTEALLEGGLDGRLQPTSVESLEVLPAGELPPNPAEMLGSQRMQELLGSIAQRADVVLLDSPPALPVTDAVVLASEVDAVLLVVAAGETRCGALQQAVGVLRQVGANVIGVILNKVSTDRGGYYYYYHYGGRYTNENGKQERRKQQQN